MSVSRRDFARLAVLAAAAPALAEMPEVPRATVPSAEAEARVAMILGRYGSRFTEAQKADLRRLILGAQDSLEAMRAYPLDNAIEPATVFRVRRPAARPRKVVAH
jgi:hypothetical protein